MKYNKGDVVSLNPETLDIIDNDQFAVIIQADWFNEAKPPSYVVSPLTTRIYKELDFRPIITPDNQNNISKMLQVIIDKPRAISSKNIVNKIGRLNRRQMENINGCLRAILNL